MPSKRDPLHFLTKPSKCEPCPWKIRDMCFPYSNFFIRVVTVSDSKFLPKLWQSTSQNIFVSMQTEASNCIKTWASLWLGRALWANVKIYIFSDNISIKPPNVKIGSTVFSQFWKKLLKLTSLCPKKMGGGRNLDVFRPQYNETFSMNPSNVSIDAVVFLQL